MESNGSQDGHLWATSHNLFSQNTKKNYGETPKVTSIQSTLINNDDYGKQNNNQLKKFDNFLQSNNDFTTRPNLNQQSPQSLFIKNENNVDNNKKDIIKFGMVFFKNILANLMIFHFRFIIFQGLEQSV